MIYQILHFLLKKLDELCVDFDPKRYSDREMYIEKLVRIVKQLKKKKINKKVIKIFATAKPLHW